MVALGTDLIDSTFPFEFLGSHVMIKFKDYAFPETIILEPERAIAPIKDHSKFFWKLAVLHYSQLVQEKDPYLWVEGHGSASYLGGSAAASALQLINAAVEGRQLSNNDAAALTDMPQLIKEFIASNPAKSVK
jgi:hypothetical protein